MGISGGQLASSNSVQSGGKAESGQEPRERAGQRSGRELRPRAGGEANSPLVRGRGKREEERATGRRSQCAGGCARAGTSGGPSPQPLPLPPPRGTSSPLCPPCPAVSWPPPPGGPGQARGGGGRGRLALRLGLGDTAAVEIPQPTPSHVGIEPGSPQASESRLWRGAHSSPPRVLSSPSPPQPHGGGGPDVPCLGQCSAATRVKGPRHPPQGGSHSAATALPCLVPPPGAAAPPEPCPLPLARPSVATARSRLSTARSLTRFPHHPALRHFPRCWPAAPLPVGASVFASSACPSPARTHAHTARTHVHLHTLTRSPTRSRP